jgi:hypothetical protein
MEIYFYVFHHLGGVGRSQFGHFGAAVGCVRPLPLHSAESVSIDAGLHSGTVDFNVTK